MSALSRLLLAALCIGVAACDGPATASTDAPAPSTAAPSSTAASSTVVRDVLPASSAPAGSAAALGSTSAPAATSSSAAAAPSSTVAHVGFVGDLSFSMHVESYLNGYPADPPVEAGYPLTHVADRLRSYDFTVGNLECVMSERGTPRIPRPLTCPDKSAQVLLDAGFDLVSVANNHVQDMSDEGYVDMLRRLDRIGLPYTGHLVKPGQDPLVVREVNGIKIAVLGYFNRRKTRALDDLARARKVADFVVVFPHWGIDFGFDPLDLQRRWAHELIAAGADLIVGAHSHIVQEEELIDGKLVAYSLGNFVFSGMYKPGSRSGAILEVDIGPGGKLLDHRYQRVSIDERGVPRLEGEPTATPPLPSRPRRVPRSD
ncbi:MAG: CapA family protein [Polyangiaceae bacterium]